MMVADSELKYLKAKRTVRTQFPCRARALNVSMSSKKKSARYMSHLEEKGKVKILEAFLHPLEMKSTSFVLKTQR